MLDRLCDALLSGIYKKAAWDTEYYKCNELYCPLGVALDLIDPTRWVKMAESKGSWYDAGYYLETFLTKHGIAPETQRLLRQMHRKNKSFADMVAAIRGTDMHQHVAQKFVEYLESGRYPQQTGWSRALCQGGQYTALGVLSELAKDEGLVVCEILNQGEEGQVFDIASHSWITFSREIKTYRPATSALTYIAQHPCDSCGHPVSKEHQIHNAEMFLLGQSVKDWANWDGFVPDPVMPFEEYAKEIRRKYIKPAPEAWQLLIGAVAVFGPLLVSALYLWS